MDNIIKKQILITMKNLNSKEYKTLINHLLDYLDENDNREDLRDILLKLIDTKTINDITLNK